MLPNNAASTTRMPAEFLPPDDLATDPLEDFELGPVAINDVTQGLRARRWRLFYEAATVKLQPDGGSPTSLFSLADLERIALAFDQLGRPHVAYTAGGTAYLRWYDPLAAAFVTTSFGDARDLRLTLDDKRQAAAASSDIILAYLRGSSLYYRQQRDRYATERQLATGLPAYVTLKRVGLARNNRLQFDLT